MARSEGAAALKELGYAPEFDIVVVGAGAAGLSAALFAAIRGGSVLVVERTGSVGGTSALTAGTLWVPGTRVAAEAGGPPNDAEEAAKFLDLAVGDRSDSELRQAFLQSGPEAIKTLEEESDVAFIARSHHPDYMAEVPGAATGFRALEAVPFNGSLLPWLGIVREQSREFTVMGGMMLSSEEIPRYSEVARSPLNPRNYRTAAQAVSTVARHLLSRARHPRATRMTMGNALIGRLLLSLQRRKVPILLQASVTSIDVRDGRVVSVDLAQADVVRTVQVGRGLVAATGGFNLHPARRERLLPGLSPEWSAVAPGTTGQLHDLIETLGGHYGPQADSPAFWAPVSLPPRRDGTHGIYPHFALDRAKPGFLVVDRRGDRYLNESTSYHRFGLAMQSHPEGLGVPSYLVGDARAVRRYGMGVVRLGGWGLRRRIRDGYLVRAGSIVELATKLGMEPERLERSVAAINAYARTGVDPDHGRGTTVYERGNGDADHRPNPSIGRLATPPFYAIRLLPSDIGASTGFVTDVNAQVLRSDNTPIAGLYAIGNDMQSVMGDRYPAPGITLGPAVAFAYIAMRHALTGSGLSDRAIPERASK